jgi:hypothetical protein
MQVHMQHVLETGFPADPLSFHSTIKSLYHCISRAEAAPHRSLHPETSVVALMPTGTTV